MSSEDEPTGAKREALQSLFEAHRDAYATWLNEDLTEYIRNEHVEDDETFEVRFFSNSPYIFVRAESRRAGQYFCKTFYFSFDNLDSGVGTPAKAPGGPEFTIEASLVASDDPIPLDDIIEYIEHRPAINTYTGRGTGTEFLEAVDEVWEELTTEANKAVRKMKPNVTNREKEQ